MNTQLKQIYIGVLAMFCFAALPGCGIRRPDELDRRQAEAVYHIVRPGGGVSTAEAAPAALQNLNLALCEQPRTLDPAFACRAVSYSILTNTREPLIRLSSTGQNQGYTFVAAGAYSWEHNAEGTVWTFHLRENYWEDGEPVTAHHYVFGMRRKADPETASPHSFTLAPLLNFDAVSDGIMPVEELGVRAIDDRTLEVILSAPTPAFKFLTTQRGMMPMRADFAYAHGEMYGTDAARTISNGPFRVYSWTAHDSLVLVPNRYYWNSDSVFLEKVTFLVMPDIEERHAAFADRRIDMITAASRGWKDQFLGIYGVSSHVMQPSEVISYVLFNTQDPLFQNADIRRAFMLATDRAELNYRVFDSFRIPAQGWVVPSIYVGAYNFRKQAPNPITDLQSRYPDPRTLLIRGMEELGLGNNPADLSVSFYIGGTGAWFRNMGAHLQAAFWEELGVSAQVVLSSWTAFFDSVMSGSFQIGFMSWAALFNEPFDVLSIFTSDANVMLTGWACEDFDDLMRRAAAEQDDRARLALYIEAERILLYYEAVVSPLAVLTVNYFWHGFIQGVRPSVFGGMCLRGVWLLEARG